MGPQVIKVEASAGTGKTYQLAKRYIELLLSPSGDNIALENFLAITFTNKAAEEMKERILTWLKEAALGKGNMRRKIASWLKNKSEHAVTPEDEKEVSARASSAVEKILHDYTDFRVGTIDSFVRKIALAGSYEMGLPPRFDISSEPSLYFDMAIDRLLDSDLELLIDFARSYAFWDIGSSWLLKKELLKHNKKIYEKWNISGILPEAYNDLLEEHNQVLTNLKKIAEEILNLIEEHNVNIDGRAKNSLKKLLQLQENSPDLEDRLKSTYFGKSLEGILRKGAQAPEEIENLWCKFKDKYKKLVFLRSLFKYNSYLKVNKKFIDTLQQIKEEKNLVFLDELNRIVNEKIKTFSVPQLYISLSAQLFHFLFDEFQDTNRLQWENIWPLMEESFSRGKGSIFVVGDRKQSIYRFRGGDPELFSDIDEYIKKFGIHPQQRDLQENRRSREEILNFVKNFFSPKKLEELIEKLINNGKDSKLKEELREFIKRKIGPVYSGMEKKHRVPENLSEDQKKRFRGGYVEVRKIMSESEALDEEREKVLLQIIDDVLERFLPGEVVVLVRKNEEGSKVAKWLIEAGKQVISQSTMSLKENFRVQDIVSLMRFLDTPVDNIPFVSFIVGETFREKLGARVDVQKFLEDSIDEISKGVPLYTCFREKFPDIWQEYFDELFSRSVGFLPPYDLAVKIIEKWGIRTDVFVSRFLELLWEREAQGENSIKRFLEFWDYKDKEDLVIDTPTGVNAIRVLTIHKAKGLEAPVVILPFLGMNLSNTREPIEYIKNGKLYLLDLKKEWLKNVDFLKDLYVRHQAESFLDELNALYVGFTRAKDELYTIIASKVNKNGEPSDKFYFLDFDFMDKKEEGFFTMGEKVRRVTMEEKESEKECIEYFPSVKWSEKIAEKKLLEFPSISSLRAKERGEAIHRVLENIGQSIPSEKELREIIHRENADPGVLPMLNRVFKDNPDLFAGEVSTELEIVDEDGQSYRIDRVVTGETITVFEFKTGEEYAESHEEQVKKYLSVISRIFPHKEVKGVLLYIDKNERKEIAWEG